PGSALVDIAIDQGGIAETSHPTSHSKPLYVEEGVVHYCVPNMPSACARTATLALAQATLPYVVSLADRGLEALAADAGLANGLQVHAGQITHAGLAQDTGRTFHSFNGRSPRAAMKIPASSIRKPPSCNVLKDSPNSTMASSADPIGSPRIETATNVAVSLRSAQLNAVCPINCGPIASNAMNP
ncbi:MAG TPA: hypothetical protein VIU02_12160, partial [Burkholderiales bacterium]